MIGTGFELGVRKKKKGGKGKEGKEDEMTKSRGTRKRRSGKT